MNEEPFAQVAVIQRFEVRQHHRARQPPAVQHASYAFAKSATTATADSSARQRHAHDNHFGLALPETPFGGIKDNRYGHEGGIEGLQAFWRPSS